MSKYKSIYIYIFLHYIIMKSPISNNSINAIKDVRKLFNELRSNLSREETELQKNSIKRKRSRIL